MEMNKAIVVESVTKKYKLFDNAKERLYSLVAPNKYGEDFYALTNVSFEAGHGEVIGFVGINGSGKSTLSNIIAGIVPETFGTVKVNGQASLIAVSAGLKNDLTGRDNIELKLLMLGFNKSEIRSLENDIIEFAELEKFIDQPVNSYSSGMRSRLGFSISVNINPDILIIDEALSVGDKAFAEKSLQKMEDFKTEGKTMIFVSHSLGQMKKFCQKILWLEYGQVKAYGSVDEILPQYEMFLEKWQKMKKQERKDYRDAAIVNQQSLLAGETKVNNIDIDDFMLTNHKKQAYSEKVVSILGRVNGKELHIYQNPKDISEHHSTEKYMNQTYYIKRKATYEDSIYYLLSTMPSGVNGVIGWMHANDLYIHRHVFIDNDRKIFSITGVGYGFNRPWGRNGNRVIDDLEQYKGALFIVIETNLVGNNTWYKGNIEGVEDTVFWIHQSGVETAKTKASQSQ